MNDSANFGAVGEQDAVVDLGTVCERELDEIALRRERAFDRREDEPVVRESLIGLALSGGGVRSAAFALGVLQGLHRYGVLPFIDYLSTVSGGGYAGAYLSSSSLNPQAANADGSISETPFLIADAEGRQSPRMLKFIHGGRYLRKTGVFVNRYLVGLFLIWLVVLSGLMAAASLVSYVFRMLDSPTGIEWTSALGFQDDLQRALFPSFVVFMLWFLLWGVSYFKFGRHATGNVARVFFYLLIASLLVAIAALLGTGDISLAGGSSNSFSATFKSIIFGTIAASLLPYLTPRRLIQSGTDPKNVGERYIFWLTTRALAYGVPFVFVAFFARENISKYNDYRDQRLVRTDVKTWSTDSPIWAPLVDSKMWTPLEEGTNEALYNEKATLKPGNIWASSSRLYTLSTAYELEQLPEVGTVFTKIIRLSDEADHSHPVPSTPGNPAQNVGTENTSGMEIPERLARLPLSDLQSLHNDLTPILRKSHEPGATGRGEKEKLSEICDALRMMIDIQIQERMGKLLVAHEVDGDKIGRGPDDEFDESDIFERPRQYAEISFLNRWWHFLAYAGECLIGDDEEAAENLLSEVVAAKAASRTAKDRTIDAINHELGKHDFYATFLPSNLFEEEPVTKAKVTTKDIGDSTTTNGAQVRNDSQSSDDSLGTPELAISENLTEDTAISLAVAEFERVRAFHPDSTADEWIAALRTLYKQAQQNEKNAERPRTLAGSGLPAAVSADSQRIANYSINHKLLRAYYGDAIGVDRSKVFASVVLVEDQRTRWQWFVLSAIVFVFASACVDLNATSWHGFYSTRIASMWIEKTPGLVNGTPMAQLETTRVGRPYHLLTGAIHTGSVHDGAEYTTKRDRFLFSKLHCGSETTGYMDTGRYMDGEYTLEDAVAISGAAVSPIQTDNPLIVGLLFLSNIRLGQWVPDPGHRSQLPQKIQRVILSTPFTPLRFLYTRLVRFLYNRNLTLQKPSFCFVTDGGHHENLGIESLLKRRCRLIIAADAGQDSDFVFADLTRLIRNAKRNDGITFVPMNRGELPLALGKLVPDPETRLAREHFIVVKIRYPDGPCGYLAYLKPTLTGDEPFELRQFHRTQQTFPHDPTSDQFYDADRFDSYRSLGLHIASELCDSMTERDRDRLANMDSRAFIQQFVGEFDVGNSRDEADVLSDEAMADQVRELLAELRVPDTARHESARAKLEQLAAASFAAMPDLLRALLDEQWNVKLCVQQLLYEYPRDALPRLVEVIANADDPQLQIAAADVFWEYGSGPYDLDLSPAIAPLVGLSASRQVAARAAAARTLAVIGEDDPAAQQALKRCKSDRSKRVRDACLV